MFLIRRFSDLRHTSQFYSLALAGLLATFSTQALAQYQVSDSMFPARNAKQEELGNLLFFDKILSGNQNISCASCHHSFAGTGDGLALPVGAGGTGFGVARESESKMGQLISERVPRNAPSIFNLGASDFTDMFHDGRVAVDSSQASGFLSPAGDNLPSGLNTVLAAQAMFPVTSGTEMAGRDGENSIAIAAAAGDLAGASGVWAQLADRLRGNSEYAALFIDAFDHINTAADISFADAANAIAAFEAGAWRCTDTPFDRAVGSDGALSNTDVLDSISPKVLRGADLFYGKANCSACHTGPFQTDQRYHSIAMVQIGPGKGDGFNGRDDFGREKVSGEESDRYKFRTPSLRQVAFTGPWGHAGAYDTLEAVIRHHLDPAQNLDTYDTSQAKLISRADLDAEDFILLEDDNSRAAIAASSELPANPLTDGEVSDLVEFLTVGLTDMSCVDLRRDVPARLPSGLPVAD